MPRGYGILRGVNLANYGDDEVIALLTTIPGFDFSECQVPRGVELAGMKEIILTNRHNRYEFNEWCVLWSLMELFEHATGYSKQCMEEDDYSWLDMWKKSRWSQTPKTKVPNGTHESLKTIIDFYVAGFKKGYAKAGKDGLHALVVGHQDQYGLVRTLMSVAEWIELVDGVKYDVSLIPTINEEMSKRPPWQPYKAPEKGQGRRRVYPKELVGQGLLAQANNGASKETDASSVEEHHQYSSHMEEDTDA
ncbi:hypothetical protein F5Y13DRAFT_189365 [Hypoxylon sp. FL1857]|nr:hypothetical protein F5Y13DRAFT_189365 [Hypoxylon sp. FL1857]